MIDSLSSSINDSTHIVIHLANTTEVRNVFFSAFAGAFFAFLFLRLAEFINRKIERRERNHQALVKVELIGNDHLDALGRNIYNIDQMVKQLKIAKSKGLVLISSNRPQPLSIDEKITFGLINIDLINDFFSYNLKIKRCNTDLNGILNLYDFYRDALVQKSISPEIYMSNFERCISYFLKIKKYLIELQEHSKKIIATVRIRYKKDKLFIRKHHERNFKYLLEKEVEKINSEIESVRKKSQAEIDKVEEKQRETPNTHCT